MDRSFTNIRTIVPGLVLATGLLASCVASSPLPAATGASSTAPASAAAATESPTATAATLCDVSKLRGRITQWTGAAGSRIASITLSNSGAACQLSDRLKPQLLDGHGTVLVDGTVVGTAAMIGAGATVTGLVEVSNYCGPTPAAPVTIGLVLTGRTRVTLTPPSQTDVTVPPCNGPGAPAHMEMHPLA